MDDLNPYAPPVDLTGQTTLNDEVRYFRDGDFLAVRDGAELPKVCILTNGLLETGAWRKRVRIVWTPPWVYILILVNIVVMALVALVVRKKGKITYSVGSYARKRIIHRRSIGFLMLALCFSLILLSIWEGAGSMLGIYITASVLCLIVALIFFVIANPVKVVKFKNGWFRIKGCSKDFLASLPQHPSPF